MNGDRLKKLRIFIASPSDVVTERAKLETVVDSLKPMADYLGLTLEVVDWRDVVPDVGRPQQVIFNQLDPSSWDIFVGVLWHRFGTPPGAKDKSGKDYLSGTEEEFKTVYQLWKQYGKPRIVLYRCTRTLPYDVDSHQLEKVREFFRLIEDVKGGYPTLYQAFDTTEAFEKLLLDNLQKLLIEYGAQSQKPITPEVAQVLAPTIPNNLPRRAAFFGRAKEMETVMRALSPADRTWGVLVDGIGGIGKSAIAVEAAYHAQEAGLFDAYVFVTAKQNILETSGIRELNPPAQTLDEFLNETARVLGQPGIAKLTSNEKRRAIIDILHTVRALIIYDNLETLSKEEQEAVADFLRELPQGCKAITTSRRRGGEGGVWLRVEKLDWEAARGIIGNEIARDVRLANKLNHIVETRWQELFDETNGSPLALVHTLGLMRVRTTLTFDRALEMLRGNRDEDLQKFIFKEAHKELAENDRTALGTLSFFVPSTTYEAWAEVSELSRNALDTTIDRLSALSLVDVLQGEERYALHPLTRVFVRDELLSDASIAREMGMRFARYWVDYAERHGGSSRNYTKFNLLEMEWSNLDAAAKWLGEMTHIQDDSLREGTAASMFVRLTRAVERFLRFSNRWDEHQSWNEQSYEMARLLADSRSAGWCARAVAWTLHYRGHTDQAELWAEKCAMAWSKGGSANERAIAIKLLGTLAKERKDYPKAEELFLQALQMRRDAGTDKGVAIMLTDLGELAHERGDYDTAEKYYQDGLKWAQDNGDKPRQASRMTNLGELALDRARLPEARSWFEQGFVLTQEVGRQDEIARIKKGLARLYEAEGRADLALPLGQEALKIYERLQHKDLGKVRDLVERLEKKMRAKE